MAKKKKETLLDIVPERLLPLSKAEMAFLGAIQNTGWAYFDSSGACFDQYGRGATDNTRKDISVAILTEIRAELISWILVDKETHNFIQHKGLALCGSRIIGMLDATYASFPWPLKFINCQFSSIISLQDANIGYLMLRNTHTKEIEADRVKINGPVFFHNGVKSIGEIRFAGATIQSDFDFCGATLYNNDGFSLDATGINVIRNVFFRHPFSSEGGINFQHAKVGLDFDCGGGYFKGNNIKSSQKPKYAICADGIKVGGNILLNDNFQAKGEVRFLGSSVNKDINCSRGTFDNPEDFAIAADGCRVSGSIFLRGAFNAKGGVWFPGCQIGGDFALSWDGFRNPTVDSQISLENTTISGKLIIMAPFWVNKGGISLFNATTKILWDTIDSWPIKGCVHLDGFSYKYFHPNASKSPIDRIGWLALQSETCVSPQPYEQLAKALRDAGHDAESKEILFRKGEIEHERLQQRVKAARLVTYITLPAEIAAVLFCLKYLATTLFGRAKAFFKAPGIWDRVAALWKTPEAAVAMKPNLTLATDLLWRWLLGWAVGYGLKSRRALVRMVQFWLLGALIFLLGYGAMTTAAQSVYTSTTPATPSGAVNDELPGTPFWNTWHEPARLKGAFLSDDYPHFNALLYSLDTLIPLVDFNLNQKKYWYPNSNHPLGVWLYVYLIIHTTAGWVLVSLLAASLAGVIKK